MLCLLILERGTQGGERNINRLPTVCGPTRDRTRNLGMCPDWESNPQPLGVQDDTLSNQVTQPGLNHWSYCTHSFAFSRMSWSWTHTFCSLSDFFHLLINIYVSSSFLCSWVLSISLPQVGRALIKLQQVGFSLTSFSREQSLLGRTRMPRHI